MNQKKYAYALPFALLLATSACSSAFNGPEEAMTVAEAHPISVDNQIVTMTIDADDTTSDLSEMDAVRLRAFAMAYLRDGHGPITVTAPSGASNDVDGHEAASDVRKALHAAGVPWSAISGASYRTGGDADDIVVSYTHYVATPSECGVWSGLRMRGYKNLRSPNHGCATMNNLAAMVADPRDLIAPADEGPADAAQRVRAVDLFRTGEKTASEIDGTIQSEVSN